VRPGVFERAGEGGGVEHVGAQLLHAVAHEVKVLVVAEVAVFHDPEHLVAVLHEQLGEVRAVLASDSGHERAAGGHCHRIFSGLRPPLKCCASRLRRSPS
jgi:hypothetical protein